MTTKIPQRIKAKITPVRWSVRTSAIIASTLAVIDLIKQEYALSLILGVSWLFIVQAEKRMFKPPTDN